MADQKCFRIRLKYRTRRILKMCFATVLTLAVLGASGSSSMKRRRLQEQSVESKLNPTNPTGTCIEDRSQLLRYWQPLRGLTLDDSPWTADEQAKANDAAQVGLDELVGFYDSISEERIRALGNDAVTSLIDQARAYSNKPAFYKKALLASARNIKISTKKYVSSEKYYPGCSRTYRKMKFTAFADYLSQRLPEDRELARLRDSLVNVTNDMFRDCGSIDHVIADRMKSENLNVMEELKKPGQSNDNVWDMLLSAIALVDCMAIPELHVLQGTEDFVAGIWKYLGDWRITYARDVKGGFRDKDAFDMAYTVTHAAYVPTGYGRHAQVVDDAPWLFRYLRENFYWALDHGRLSMVSEFVDILRSYGCTEENDVQVRHGTRWILDYYKKAGSSWIAMAKKKGREPSDYDIIHKPWTGISGVARGRPEPIVPGSYGFAFKSALQQAEARKLSTHSQ